MTSEFWANAGFTIIGALIGGIATLVAARFTWQRQHYNEAAAVFRTSFVEEIYHLRKGDEDVFRILTPEAFARHERQKIIFEQFLGSTERQALEVAWVGYLNNRRTPAPGSLDNRPADLQRALSVIDQLLSCAKPK